MKTCDNHVVGVLIADDTGRLLMFQRATPPAGIAPVAGHVEHHGSVVDAALAEVREEVGLDVIALRRVHAVLLPDSCGSRDLPGPEGFDHHWTVFWATRWTGQVCADEREARRPTWYTPAQVQALADYTVSYAHGTVPDTEFTTAPGLEPVWVLHLHRLGMIRVGVDDLVLIYRLAGRAPSRDLAPPV